MKLVAAVLLAASAGTAPAPEAPGSVTVTISAEDAAKCDAQGGCGIFSRARIEEMQRLAFEAGKAEATHEAEAACWRSRKEV